MNHVDLEPIVGRHLQRLFQKALLWTGEYDTAWDLVQDTWERALRHFPDSLPEDRVWSWLATVMRNRFMDQVRRSDSRRNLRLDEEQWQLLPGPAPDDGQDWQRFTEDDIRDCLPGLPEEIRAPFRLHALEGMPYEEVASHLRVRMSTVGTRILRARRMLRGLLEGAPHAAPATRPAPRAARDALAVAS